MTSDYRVVAELNYGAQLVRFPDRTLAIDARRGRGAVRLDTTRPLTINMTHVLVPMAGGTHCALPHEDVATLVSYLPGWRAEITDSVAKLVNALDSLGRAHWSAS